MIKIQEGNCNLVFPDSPKSYIDTFQTEVGSLLFYTYTFKDSTLNYQFSFCTYPVGTLHSDSIDLLKDFFSSTIEESVTQLKGVKKYESEITQFGYPGWFWKTAFGTHYFMKTKCFVAGRTFYTMQVFGPDMNDDEQKIFAFMDSFKFLSFSHILKQ